MPIPSVSNAENRSLLPNAEVMQNTTTSVYKPSKDMDPTNLFITVINSNNQHMDQN